MPCWVRLAWFGLEVLSREISTERPTPLVDASHNFLRQDPRIHRVCLKIENPPQKKRDGVFPSSFPFKAIQGRLQAKVVEEVVCDTAGAAGSWTAAPPRAGPEKGVRRLRRNFWRFGWKRFLRGPVVGKARSWCLVGPTEFQPSGLLRPKLVGSTPG